MSEVNYIEFIILIKNELLYHLGGLGDQYPFPNLFLPLNIYMKS